MYACVDVPAHLPPTPLFRECVVIEIASGESGRLIEIYISMGRLITAEFRRSIGALVDYILQIELHVSILKSQSVTDDTIETTGHFCGTIYDVPP